MKNRYLRTIALGLGVVTFCFIATFEANAQKKAVQKARVEINQMGYSPEVVKLKRGIPALITFIRTTENTCGTEIVIPQYAINRPLPLGQAVTVSFTPKKTGTLGFSCGMDMLRGKLIITQ